LGALIKGQANGFLLDYSLKLGSDKARKKMPITRSAQKALRQSKAKRQVNQLKRQSLAQAVKAARKSLKKTSLLKAVSALDQAARKKIIHKNKAARLKSRLAKRLAASASRRKSKKTN
jgi:small subunit ribosomal protein S20